MVLTSKGDVLDVRDFTFVVVLDGYSILLFIYIWCGTICNNEGLQYPAYYYNDVSLQFQTYYLAQNLIEDICV